MTKPGKTESTFGRRARNVAAAVGIRLLAVAAVTLLIVLTLGDVGSLYRAWLPGNFQTDRQSATPLGEVGWPHLRGPAHNAVSGETGLADSWPDEGPPVLWMHSSGRGYSGFSVVGRRAYTQTQTLTAQYVVCLDADTGRQVWRHKYAWPYEPGGMYPGPRATPTVSDGRVYFAGPDSTVGCLEAGTGKPIWQINVNHKFGGRGTEFGYSCSPLVEDGKVILPVGGLGASLVALDAADGATVWASGDEPASYCSAMPLDFGGRRCVVAFLQNALVLVDLDTGRQLWEEVYSHGYDEHSAAVLYDEPYLMVAQPFKGGAECFRLQEVEVADTDDGLPGITLKSVWQSRELSNDTASSLTLDGHVWGFDLRDVQAKLHRPSRGEFKCMDLATGKLLWQTDQTGHATVLAADGKLILLNDRGELILARAGAQRYEELARTSIFEGEICWTAPALDRGRLYLRSPSRAACVYLGPPDGLDAERLQSARSASSLSRSTPWNLNQLVGGEREYAFDPADAEELGRWFAYSLIGVLGVAATIAAAAGGLAFLRWPVASVPTAWGVFWTASFLLGAAGTPIFNRLTDSFIFTWPVCLFVAHQVTLNTVVWAGRTPGRRSARWITLLVTCGFVAVCLGYFLACRRLSLATEWAFLVGFLPSWPFAVPAARCLQRRGGPVAGLAWVLLSFTAFFWSAGALLLWRAAAL